MSTEWNDHTLDDILSDVQRMTRERDASQSESAEPAFPKNRWTLAEVDQLLGLNDDLFGIPKRAAQSSAGEEPLILPSFGREPQSADIAPAAPLWEPERVNAPMFPIRQPEPEFDSEWVVASAVPTGEPEKPKPQDDEAVIPFRDTQPPQQEDIKSAAGSSPAGEPEQKTQRVPDPSAAAEGKTKVLGHLTSRTKHAEPKPPAAPRRPSAPEMVDGQMMLQGFETEEPVQQMDEAQAEQELHARRKAQIRDFKLYDFAQKYEPDLPPKEDIFAPQPEPGAVDAGEIADEDEYVRLSDRMRIGRLLQEDRRKAFLSLCALLVFSVASVVISAIAGKVDGGTRQALYAVDLGLLCLSVVVCISSIYAGIRDLIRWKPTCCSAAIVTVIAALIHGVVTFVLPGAAKVGGTFCTPAVLSLLLCKCAALSESIGVLGNFKFCAFTAAEHLHTVRDFESASETYAVAKALEQPNPRLRFAQPVKFATHFRAHSVFYSLLDRVCKIMLPAAFGAAVIMAVTGWLVSGNASDATNGVVVALNAFTSALCVALPSGAALTVTIPTVMQMRALNRRGGMIASPEAALAHAGVSAAVADSVDLYDPRHTEIFCYQDYGAIRIDDVFLYAAALAVGADSPAGNAFLHTVGNPDILPPVRSLIYEERLGISAYIRNQSVLLGSRNLLSNHSIDPPAKSVEVPYLQEGKRVLYLAVGSKVCAMFVMDYVPRRMLSVPLRTLQDNDTRLLVYAPDCNLTEDFIAAGFGVRKGEVQTISPAAGELLRTRQAEESENAPATVLHNGTTEGFLEALAGAAVIRNIQRIAAFVAVIGCGIGWLVSFILLMVKGAAILNWIFAVLYPALWIAISLALGIVQVHKSGHS